MPFIEPIEHLKNKDNRTKLSNLNLTFAITALFLTDTWKETLHLFIGCKICDSLCVRNNNFKKVHEREKLSLCELCRVTVLFQIVNRSGHDRKWIFI